MVEELCTYVAGCMVNAKALRAALKSHGIEQCHEVSSYLVLNLLSKLGAIPLRVLNDKDKSSAVVLDAEVSASVVKTEFYLLVRPR
jgi:hypothetical protein